MGKGSKERDKSVGEMISELNIIREQLRHPNVVRYYKTFVERELLSYFFNKDFYNGVHNIVPLEMMTGKVMEKSLKIGSLMAQLQAISKVIKG